MAKERMPLIGDRFPEMLVKTTQGDIKLPTDYSGKWLMLFSHPGDFTPVCTTEFVAFETRREDFCKLNTELIGLSIDQVFAHLKWIQWINDNLGVEIQFPIIADEQGNVAKRLGMIHPNKGTNTVRAVFIIDNKGIVRAILYYPQEVGRNISEILRLIHALQVTDQYKVATPANWPQNNLIGSDVIIPPANTEKMAKERLHEEQYGEINCFDWWFCHYNLYSNNQYKHQLNRNPAHRKMYD
ncbi:MAG: peroxiredoxin [Pelosinus sp.]|nr:peroxiredoxin [Pelosinus sp.]